MFSQGWLTQKHTFWVGIVGANGVGGRGASVLFCFFSLGTTPRPPPQPTPRPPPQPVTTPTPPPRQPPPTQPTPVSPPPPQHHTAPPTPPAPFGHPTPPPPLPHPKKKNVVAGGNRPNPPDRYPKRNPPGRAPQGPGGPCPPVEEDPALDAAPLRGGKGRTREDDPGVRRAWTPGTHRGVPQ